MLNTSTPMLHRGSCKSLTASGIAPAGNKVRSRCLCTYSTHQSAAKRPAGPACIGTAATSTNTSSKPRAAYHSTKATKASSVETSEAVYTINGSPDQSIEAIRRAQATAEAEQQQLMTTGPLADAMKSNQLLNRVIQHHLRLQCLYHKGVQRILQRIPQHVGDAAGTVYALSCVLLGRPIDKQPGETITKAELNRLAAETMLLPADEVDEDVLQYMHVLKLLMLGQFPALGTEVFVIRDLLTILAGSDEDLAQKAQMFGEALGLPDIVSKGTGFALEQLQSAAASRARQPLQQALLLACRPASSPIIKASAQDMFTLLGMHR